MSNGERLRNALRRVVVIGLLGVWSFPATGLATPAAPIHRVTSPAREAPAAAPAAEAASLAARERQATALQDFKGGGVSIYIGSGVLVVLVIVLLLILLI